MRSFVVAALALCCAAQAPPPSTDAVTGPVLDSDFDLDRLAQMLPLQESSDTEYFADDAGSVMFNDDDSDWRRWYRLDTTSNRNFYTCEWDVTFFSKPLTTLLNAELDFAPHWPDDDSVIGSKDRIRNLIGRLNQLSPNPTTFLDFVRIAVRLSKMDQQPLWIISQLMMQFAFECVSNGNIVLGARHVGALLHLMMQYEFLSRIQDELWAIAEIQTPQSLSVRNDDNETLLTVALRLSRDFDHVRRELIKRTPASEQIVQCRSWFGRLDDRHWAFLFKPVIDHGLRAADYRLDVLLDRLQVREPALRRRAELAIRIRDAFFHKPLLLTHIALHPAGSFTAALSPLAENADSFDKVCRVLGIKDGRRRMLADTVQQLVSGAITLTDVLDQCVYPFDLAELQGILAQTVQGCEDCSTEEVDASLARRLRQMSLAARPDARPWTLTFIEQVLRHVEVDLGDLTSPENAAVVLPFVLQRMVPDVNLDCPSTIGRIADFAVQSDSGVLRTNLLRMALSIRVLRPELDTAWAATFTRADVLADRALWLDLLRICNVVLDECAWTALAYDSEAASPETSVVRITARLISHSAMRAEIQSFGQGPISDDLRMVRDFLAGLPPAVLVRVYLAVDDVPELGAIFRFGVRQRPMAATALHLFYMKNYCVWVRHVLFRDASDQSITEVADDVCAVCLNPHYTSENVPDGADPDSYSVKSPCGHMFHTNCIVAWIRRKPRCPLRCGIFFCPVDQAVQYVRRNHQS